MTRAAGPLRLLVVDDDPFVRDLLASILEDDGYRVVTAANGAAAAAIFSAGPGVDLIVSDMNMPELDGQGLIRAVRGAGSDVPIVILTGNNEVTTAIEALKGGADDYLLKDENIRETIGISVHKALEQHLLRRQNRQLLEDLAVKNERLENEKALAQKVQKNILPRALRFPGFAVATLYRPSDKIGGDFFDAWESAGRIHFLVGDVSGHSTPSALMMAAAKGILHSLGHTLGDPREIVRAANRMICSIVGDSGMFLTLFYGVYDRAREEIAVVSAGHSPGFLAGAGGRRRLEATGPVVGWDPDDDWGTATLPFAPGSSLVLYTDGLTEARDGAGREYGEEALEALLEPPAPPAVLVERVVREVEQFCSGEFGDDLTLFVLARTAAAAGAGERLALTVEPTFAGVDRVREAVQALCRARYPWPAAQEKLGEFSLAIVEAMNNAVEHAGAAAMEIEVRAGLRALSFRLTTAGEPFDPTVGAAFPDLDAPGGPPEGGFGRALIAELSDVLTYRYTDGKNVLTLEKTITEEEARHGD